MIDIIISLIGYILVFGFLIWFGIFTGKILLSKSKNKKQAKETLKMIDSFEKGFKKVYGYFFLILNMLIKMCMATFLAIGSKPIIYRINYPLGEGYAIVASYIVAIALYIILPDFWRSKKWHRKMKINLETNEKIKITIDDSCDFNLWEKEMKKELW